METKTHWDNIYSSKEPHEVSWTQEIPYTSIDFFRLANLNKDAEIIDVGGGESKFVDFLLDEGFKNITILDISEKALEKTKKRLREKSALITWIICDITEFKPTKAYDFWHDRATFHFLRREDQISKYLSIIQESVKENGVVTIGTFSKDGPTKCSGLDIKQYNEDMLTGQFINGFEK